MNISFVSCSEYKYCRDGRKTDGGKSRRKLTTAWQLSGCCNFFTVRISSVRQPRQSCQIFFAMYASESWKALSRVPTKRKRCSRAASIGDNRLNMFHSFYLYKSASNKFSLVGIVHPRLLPGDCRNWCGFLEVLQIPSVHLSDCAFDLNGWHCNYQSTILRDWW